jgi:hypothetical protein
MITISGSTGIAYDITTTNTSTNVGEKVVRYIMPAAYSSITYTDAALAVAYYGTVGTTPVTLDLTALVNVTGGTDTLSIQDNSAPVALANVYTLFIVNNSANVITLTPGASNSFLTASEQITVQAMSAAGYSFGAGKATSGSIKNIKLAGSVDGSSCEVYILGV